MTRFYLQDGALWDRTFKGWPVIEPNSFERQKHQPFIDAARGDCLMFGLGIGLCIPAILAKPEVTSLVVVEKHPEVLQLVGADLPLDHRLTVHFDDVFTTERFRGPWDAIFIDVWTTPEDALEYGRMNVVPDEQRQKELWARYLKPGGWIGVWSGE